MYKDYFGFNALPFENTPDPDFFFMGGRYRETLALMKHSVINKKGLMCITGPIGCGKTTLASALTNNLPDDTMTISINALNTSPKDLAHYIAKTFDIEHIPDSLILLHDQIRDALIKLNDSERQCLLIIDESQFLSDELFQEVLFLANLETEKDKLLQILLLGQLELLEKLNDPKRHQLVQRMSFCQALDPMSDSQSNQYIEHRINVAGGSTDLFSNDALNSIIHTSKGFPRIINKICDASLLKAFLLQKDTVNVENVEDAVRELGMNFFDFNQNKTFPGKPNPTFPQQALGATPITQGGSDRHVQAAPNNTQDNKEKDRKKSTIPLNAFFKKHGFDPEEILSSTWLKLALVSLVILFLITGILKNLDNTINVSQKDEISTSIPEKEELLSHQPELTKNFNEPIEAPAYSFNTRDDTIPSSIEPSEIMTAHTDKTGLYEEESYTTSTVEPSHENVTHETNKNICIPRTPTESVPLAHESTPSIEKTSYPYSILLSSFRSRVTVERALELYLKNGIHSYWTQVDLGDNDIWFRVFTGHFKSIREAEDTIKELNLKNAVVKKTKYAGLISSGSSETDINEKALSITNSGYSAYVIKDGSELFNLYAGAFYTQQGADDHCSQLISNGISCQVTER